MPLLLFLPCLLMVFINCLSCSLYTSFTLSLLPLLFFLIELFLLTYPLIVLFSLTCYYGFF